MFVSPKTHDPQALSEMMARQAAYLRMDGLAREADALSARARAIGVFAGLLRDLKRAPIRMEGA